MAVRQAAFRAWSGLPKVEGSAAMSLRRFLLVTVSVLGALVLGVVLYLAFFDLGRHKPLIENFISERTGRSFAIGGAFSLKLLPALSVVAEDVRLGNAEWDAAQPMVDIGRFSTVIDLWSLISGPVEIRTLELSDVAVLLEKNQDGAPNWVLKEPGPEEVEAEPEDSAISEVPAVIENGQLSNVQITYREPGKKDRVAVLKTLTIAPGSEDLLAIAADGGLNEYAAALQGEVGPIDALVSGRDIRMTIDGSVGNLSMDIAGSVGRLHPLDGADLRVGLANPDVGTMLKNLELPAVAEGSLKAEATLKDEGERTGLNLDATLGDIHASVTGSLQALGLTGADVNFKATVGDAARLAKVFGVETVPKEELRVSGHLAVAKEQIDFDGVDAALGGAGLRADGSIRRTGRAGSTLRFDASVENMAKLSDGLPEMPAEVKGTYVANSDGFEVKDVRLLLRQNELSGAASVKLSGRPRIDARLNSSRIELPPRKKQEQEGQQATAQPTGKAGKDGKSKREFVFSKTPLPLDKLSRLDAQLEMNLAEVILEGGALRDVTGLMKLDDGRLSVDFQAKGSGAGTIASALQLNPAAGGADLSLTATVRDMRTGFMAPTPADRDKTPPTNIDVDIRARGASPREMAADANGTILLTQGKGHVKSGFVKIFGSDILSQIGSQLNPFAVQDPFTKIQCTVVKVKLVDGQAKVDPVLMQSDKVTVTSHGHIDLDTEKLSFDFNTRPRQGIGISAGMFTNPFIQLGGTLAHPMVVTGAKGVVSGALAVGTGGLTVVAKGLVDRVTGEIDLCAKTLAEVRAGPASKEKPADPTGNRE